MVNLIADYLSGDTYRNKAYQAPGTDNAMAAAMSAVCELKREGYMPVCVHEIRGSYTLEQLSNIEAVGHVDTRMVWCDPALMQRVAAQLTPKERERAQRWRVFKR